MKDYTDNTKAQKIFTEFLASKKLRLTTQRKIIFTELLDRKEHANIDDLYMSVKKADPNIGLATMYRTVKLLTDSGLVREVDTGGGKPSYEAVAGRLHHDHLTCEICGESVEFNDPSMEKLQEEIASAYGYTLTDHALYLKGVCPKCKKSGRTK